MKVGGNSQQKRVFRMVSVTQILLMKEKNDTVCKNSN